MEFLEILFSICPFVMIISTIVIIISMSVKSKSNKWDILFKIGFFSILAYIVILVISGILAIIIAMNSLLILGGVALLIIWLTISLFIKLKNNLIKSANNGKEIYIRDVEVEYSPAVLSYLMNNKIEVKKDISATLLNLCAKNILKIEKGFDGKLVVKDLQNREEVDKLAEDEKYAYEMLTTKINKQAISEWKDKVVQEYQRYKFSKSHKKGLYNYAVWIYVISFIAIYVFVAMHGGTYDGPFAEGLAFIFVAMMGMLFASFIYKIIRTIIKPYKNSEFKDKYTRKGAKEFNKWKKFEKFIEDYTLVEEKDHENIVVLGKYLSYSIALGINKKCDKELYDKINKTYSFDYDEYANALNVEEEKEV